VLGRRGRPPTLSPPPNYQRRLNFGGLESGQDERRGEDLCAGGDRCEGICMGTHGCLEDESPRTECRSEDEHGECGGEDINGDARVNHDAGHGSDYAKSGRRGDGRKWGRARGRAGGQAKKKGSSRGATAPAPWIVDPRPRADEGNINDEDLREEEFFPSRQTEVNEEDQHQAIECISTLELLTLPPEPENQVLHYPGYHFVLDLVLACRCFLSSPLNENSIMKIFEFLNSTNHNSAES
jgi:hypothetical protein